MLAIQTLVGLFRKAAIDIGNSNLHNAVLKKDHLEVGNLLALGENRVKINKLGETALVLAAKTGEHKCALELLGLNLKFPLRDSYHLASLADTKKRGPLHWAALKGNEEITKLLLTYNADPLAQDIYGNLPLHTAAKNGKRLVLAELLAAHLMQFKKELKKGKNEFLIDKYFRPLNHDGFTPFIIAADEGCMKLIHIAIEDAKISFNEVKPIRKKVNPKKVLNQFLKQKKEMLGVIEEEKEEDEEEEFTCAKKASNPFTK